MRIPWKSGDWSDVILSILAEHFSFSPSCLDAARLQGQQEIGLVCDILFRGNGPTCWRRGTTQSIQSTHVAAVQGIAAIAKVRVRLLSWALGLYAFRPLAFLSALGSLPIMGRYGSIGRWAWTHDIGTSCWYFGTRYSLLTLSSLSPSPSPLPLAYGKRYSLMER